MVNGLLRASLIVLGLAAASGSAHATLVGSWNFGGATPLVDSTGNFGNLQLNGNASISNGALNLSGSGTSSTGWAETTSYSGPSISSKTMVAWGTLTGLSTAAAAGAMLSISAMDHDQFDAIDFGEQIANTWMNGSSNFSRTQNFTGLTETAANLNQLFQIAISYNFLGNGSELITGYINGNVIGSYTTGNAATWNAGNTVVGFGPRTIIDPQNQPVGGIDATIDAAQIYDTALTQSQIQALQQPGAAVPEPASLTLMGTGLLGLWRARRRKRK